MSHEILIATFSQEEDLLNAVKAVQQKQCQIIDVYTPYCVHGLEELLGWRRSRLPVVCFLAGVAGAAFAVWLQFWTTARDWPLNVGGRPWNSLPAFVPVAFECMVLLAGFGLVFAWMARCALFPGKTARMPQVKLVDNCFVMSFRNRQSGSEAAEQLLREFHLVSLEAREEEKP